MTAVLAAAPQFNLLSLQGLHIPSVAGLKSSIEKRRATGAYMRRSFFPDDRNVTHLGFLIHKEWMKRIARKLVAGFPDGFPSEHNIYVSLLEIPPGAEEQEVHADGDTSSEQPRSWSFFIPLTNHRMQGTTVFIVNGKRVLPPRGCSNYLFDSTVLHYGQANRSNQTRCVLMFNVGHKNSNWRYFDAPVQ